MIKYILLLPFLLFIHSNTLLAQKENLAPNGDFEEFTEPLNYSTSWTALKSWRNPNPTGVQDSSLAATPDYLNIRGEDVYTRLPESFFGTVYPHSGLGAVGIVTYNSAWANGREYIYSKLKKPLQKGSKYEVSFWASNGEGNFYGNYGANGLGALFTTEMPIQRGHDLIAGYPQVEVMDVFFETKWKKFTFQMVADKPYQYVTLGCFRDDKHIKQLHYSKHNKPDSSEHFTYVFLDDVSISEINPKPESPVVMAEVIEKMENAPKEKEKEEKKPKEEPKPKVSKEIPRQLEGRRVDKQSTLSVEGNKLKLTIYDSRAEDQDTISLSFNGQWLIERQMVRKKPFILEVDLLPDANNTLIFFAHNLGTIPPNTAMLMVDDGKSKQKIQVQSDLKRCGAIQLKKKD